jgi:hypothetical protein
MITIIIYKSLQKKKYYELELMIVYSF